MPARKKAKFVPRIAQGDFASVIGARGFPALHLFNEKSKESTYLVSTFSISKQLAMRTVDSGAIYILMIPTAKEATGFLRDRGPECRWYFERTREAFAYISR
jgi:hypothetical protein